MIVELVPKINLSKSIKELVLKQRETQKGTCETVQSFFSAFFLAFPTSQVTKGRIVAAVWTMRYLVAIKRTQ